MKLGDIVRVNFKNYKFGMIVDYSNHFLNAYSVLLETGQIKIFSDYWLTVVEK